MTTINDHPPRLDERYASATRSSNLTPSAEHRTDADILLAAGYAAQKNRNGMVALMAYRMKITGDRASKGEIVELMMDRLTHQVARRSRSPLSLKRADTRFIVETVLGWWMNDNCPVCTGRKMEPIPGTPYLSANACKACSTYEPGMSPNEPGKRAIPNIGARFNPHAKWVATELDHMLTFIVGDMARMLRPSLDLKIGDKP